MNEHFRGKRLAEIKHALKRVEAFAKVLTIDQADEPILAAPVRAALFEWLTEIRAVDELLSVGCAPRRTALLYGPPGTGKTTLAHHLAARLGKPLVCVQSELLIDKWLGSTGRNIAELFHCLDEIEDGAVVLFDEVDAIGGKRSEGAAQGADSERNAFLTTLLTRIESYRGFMLAATNRKDALDPALWRRFGMQIDVAFPGFEERYAILSRYLYPYAIDDDSMTLLADLTDGASPSLLRQLMEGVKRSLVLAPRLNRDIADPVAVFAQIIASVAPPPGFDPPVLWRDKSVVEDLNALRWPPVIDRDRGAQ